MTYIQYNYHPLINNSIRTFESLCTLKSITSHNYVNVYASGCVQNDEPGDDKVEEEDGVYNEHSTLLRLSTREETHGCEEEHYDLERGRLTNLSTWPT